MLGLAWLGFALLPPPTPWLSVQAVRTVTAPAGADLNFTWEVKCWFWQRESFYSCAVAWQLPSPLSRDSISPTKPCVVVVTKNWVLEAEAICLLPGWYLLPHCFLWVIWSFSSEFFAISVRWLWPWWVSPFQQGDVVFWATNTVKRLMAAPCCSLMLLRLVGAPALLWPSSPSLGRCWLWKKFTCIWLTLLFIHRSLLEKSGQAFKCWSLFKPSWIA